MAASMPAAATEAAISTSDMNWGPCRPCGRRMYLLPGAVQIHILRHMIGSTLILCLVSLAQITPKIPDDATIFTVVVEMKVGEEATVYAAAIRTRDGFIREYDSAAMPPRFDLVLDEPWNDAPPVSVLKQRVKEVEPEPPAQREIRYRESRHQRVKTTGGVEVWVSDESVARKGRLNELQTALEAERAAQSVPDISESATGDPTPGGPGFAALWGRHVVILVMAAVGMVVAVKVCF